MFLLSVYYLSVFFLGFWISNKIVHVQGSRLFMGLSSVTLGLLVSLPITYLITLVLQNTNDPISFSLGIFSVMGILFFWSQRHELRLTDLVKLSNKRKGIWIDILVISFCLGISTYIMTKTFKEDASGIMYVARNAVFDFGHSLSIIRSLSWGTNIPYTSPFVSGTPQVYHFMFNFWVATLEHMGLPIGISVNVPSTLGFALFLLTLYELGIALFGRRIVGLIAMLSIVFHGGFMFVDFFRTYGFSLQVLFRNPNYMFTGPFDGSLYSLFFTLNVFVNQRHLGIALAIFFLLFYLFIQELKLKKLNRTHILKYGIFVGFFLLWHLTISVGLLFAFLCALVFRKRWKDLILLCVTAGVTSLVFVYSWIPALIQTIIGIPKGALASQSISMGLESNPFWIIKFIVLNFGIGLVFFGVGIIKYKKITTDILPLFILPILFFVISIRSGSIDQKYLNIFLVMFSLFMSVGFMSIWDSGKVGKIIVVLMLPVIMMSGIIDFMVIKNDFMYPIPNTGNGALISWIKKNIPKDAVFVAGRNIFDPVTLAGRKTYFGFYRQLYVVPPGSDDHRALVIKSIYEATTSGALRSKLAETHAQYLLLPLTADANFTYHVHPEIILNTFPKVYGDSQYLMVKVQ